MSFYYFAYGSNMLTERLKARCNSAVSIGPAEVKNWSVEFSKPSIDTSGKATLVSPNGGDHQALGVIFKIKMAELRFLDLAEGRGQGYERNDRFPVQLVSGGETIQTTTYLASATNRTLRPYDWYLALTIAGAHQHMLRKHYITTLRQTQYDIDPDITRATRMSAIDVLNATGVTDYTTLLSARE